MEGGIPVFRALNLNVELCKISLLESKGLISVVMGSFEVGHFEVFVNEEFHSICQMIWLAGVVSYLATILDLIDKFILCVWSALSEPGCKK